jgi:Uma2 family endonuclease
MRAVPRVPPFERPATYDDLVKLPDHLVAEILGGELHVSPRPAPRHAVAYARATVLLGSAFDSGRTGPGGWWILAEPELHLGPDVLVPDLAGWRRTRMPRVPETAHFPLAPDWICEVLSPSTASLDRTQKLAIYAREGVGHAWLIDPIARTLEILRLEAGKWTAIVTHAGEAAVRAEPFDAIEFNLGEFWAD